MSDVPAIDTPIIFVQRTPKYRLCAACFAGVNLSEIVIGTTTPNGANTTSVVLCADCRRRLVVALTEMP